MDQTVLTITIAVWAAVILLFIYCWWRFSRKDPEP